MAGRPKKKPDYDAKQQLDAFLEELTAAYQEADSLRTMAAELAPDLQVLLGCEFHVNTEMVQMLKHGERPTLNGTSCVLTEFSQLHTFQFIENSCHELLTNGYTPVIAHAERYPILQKNLDYLERLHDMGAYIQMNADSISGADGLRMKWFCKKVMKDELLEVKEKYGDGRRTEIKLSSEEFNPEDFYADDEVVITISHLGYIKRTPLADFRTQGRGGVGSRGGATRDEDFIEYIYPATMHNTMLFFTAKGKCFWLKVYEIPEGAKNAKGRAIQNMLNIDSDDAINACLHIKKLNDAEFCNSHYVLFCTKNGVIKKTRLSEYSRPRTNGVNAITIREDDRVVGVCLTNGEDEIVLANRNGRAIRFNEDAVRAMGRTATGVKGMTLDEHDETDEVVGMICINDPERETILVVSETGFGKRSLVDDYRVTNRGGKGVKTISITEKTGKVVAIKSVTDENDLMIINKNGITIRLKLSDVRVMGRATQGVKLIDLGKRGGVIASVCQVPKEEESEDDAAASGDVVSSEDVMSDGVASDGGTEGNGAEQSAGAEDDFSSSLEG